ncbi:hypothetical protein B0H19DRAFT_1071329 [Mycena capillaripes]|nr:hypothetical protein B0H19DRAFT_1071329 [Mycena capillaripes]
MIGFSPCASTSPDRGNEEPKHPYTQDLKQTEVEYRDVERFLEQGIHRAQDWVGPQENEASSAELEVEFHVAARREKVDGAGVHGARIERWWWEASDSSVRIWWLLGIAAHRQQLPVYALLWGKRSTGKDIFNVSENADVVDKNRNTYGSGKRRKDDP